MSTVDECCEYVLNPDDPETRNGDEVERVYIRREYLNEEGVWTCPHTTEDGESLCIFHLPVSEKSDKEVIERFLEAASDTSSSEISNRRRQFIGARFGSFDLTEYPSRATTIDGVIDFTHIEVTESMDWSGLNIHADELRFKNSRFISEVDFAHTTFNQGVDFGGVQFFSETTFGSAEFKEGVWFGGARFHGRAKFNSATLSGVTSFDGVDFQDRVSFIDAIFGDSTDQDTRPPDGTYTRFNDTKFEKYSSFEYAKFNKETRFGNVEFQSATFCEAEFEDQVQFGGVVHGADFSRARFHGNTRFYLEQFDGSASFNQAEFNQTAEFSNQELEHADFEKADLTDAVFSGANLQNVNLESAILSRATLFGADLRGAKLNGAVLGDIRINQETQFLGHASDNPRRAQHTVSAVRSRPCCVYDPRYEDGNEHEDIDKAKSVYRALEEIAKKAARPRLQSQCFVRRQDLQTDGYRRVMLNAPSIQERFISGARYSRAKVARGTLLYGESPWRVIAGSISLVFMFTLLYPIGGWVRPIDGEPITYTAIVENPWLLGDTLYYSTLTFTTLGLGDYRPVGAGQYLTTANTALGAVLIALLVFVLGRRAAR